jgi:hypothetical protein
MSVLPLTRSIERYGLRLPEKIRQANSQRHSFRSRSIRQYILKRQSPKYFGNRAARKLITNSEIS